MVLQRLNERETNPNQHISFITALPLHDADSQEQARQLLRALAAQVRPVMKSHGFEINSFEEYEHNSVFAGRNWNNGEIVELVLRRPNGTFLPTSWLLSTLCHEMAHITHMNHGPAFQALWKRLNNEVRALQVKGYYGDGYWSSGTRLVDSTRVGGEGIETGDLPEYMCGGAQSRTRPTSLRRRRHRPSTGPSNHTGAQTAKKRKAGSRVTAQNAFKGKGAALNEDLVDEGSKRVGTGFKKQAQSKRAREERALAAERRLKALQGQATTPPKPSTEDSDSDSDSDSSVEEIRETDQDRRRAMLDSTDKTELDGMKSSQADFFASFFLPPSPKKGKEPEEVIDLSSDDGGVAEIGESSRGEGSSKLAGTDKSGKGATNAAGGSPSRKNDQLSREKQKTSNNFPRPSDKSTAQKTAFGPGNIVQDEVNLRKKESLGLATSSRGRKLGGSSSTSKDPSRHEDGDKNPGDWECLVCTLRNKAGHLACSACATPRGEAEWRGDYE